MEASSRADSIHDAVLSRLHRDSITEKRAIGEILKALVRDQVAVRRGLNRQIRPEIGTLTHVSNDSIRLSTRNFEPSHGPQIFLSFDLDGASYTFASRLIREVEKGELELSIPTSIFRSERRFVDRTPLRRPEAIEIDLGGRALHGQIRDTSLLGLGVELGQKVEVSENQHVTIRYHGGERAGEFAFGEIRYGSPLPEKPGSYRLGLALHGSSPSLLRVERRSDILGRDTQGRMWDRISLAGGTLSALTSNLTSRLGLRVGSPPSVPVVDFYTPRHERIRAIIDTYGDPHGAPAIVIPPAFGKTKETLLPLAATILASFRKARRPVTVVRFDGIRRRGESHNDPECQRPGREYLHYTGSQAVEDLQAAIDFVRTSPDFRSRSIVVVTFSAASTEARKLLARESRPEISGWVSVVGAPDTQSAMTKISGGVDYTRGLLQGVRFGRQEVLGILMDADRTGLDAIEHGMATYEDAKSDMEAIAVPITWIHGKYDAWMDGDRVRQLLTCGNRGNRQFIEVPTGHQLRNSAEAFAVFQLIAEEAAEMALGERIESAIPNLRALERRHRAERARLPRRDIDRRAFWADYLLGRDRTVGIELMTSSPIYGDFMRTQTDLLDLRSGMVVADLGAGTGSLIQSLDDEDRELDLGIIEIDYILEALGRSRVRHSWKAAHRSLRLDTLAADLDGHAAVPLKNASVDRVLASLLISYVAEPAKLLREIRRILRPGGVLVVSTLRKDADISKIYQDGVNSFPSDALANDLRLEAEPRDLEVLTRNFLNDGAKILELEEQGEFRFWDEDELAAFISKAGFSEVGIRRSLGDPPQAVIVHAKRPS